MIIIGFFFFNLPNPSSRTMALGSTQALTETSTRNLPWEVKRGRRVRQTWPPSVSGLSRNCGIVDVSQPFGPPRPFKKDGFTFLNNNIFPQAVELLVRHDPLPVLYYYYYLYYFMWHYIALHFIKQCKLSLGTQNECAILFVTFVTALTLVLFMKGKVALRTFRWGNVRDAKKCSAHYSYRLALTLRPLLFKGKHSCAIRLWGEVGLAWCLDSAEHSTGAWFC
jgi:hypothetical protein